MNLPNQCAPVDRTLSTASASQEQGVEASFSFGDVLSGLKKAAQVALPIAQQLLGS